MFNIIRGQAHWTPCIKVKTASLLIGDPKRCSFHYPRINGGDGEGGGSCFFHGKRCKEFCHATWLAPVNVTVPRAAESAKGWGGGFIPQTCSKNCQLDSGNNPISPSQDSRAALCGVSARKATKLMDTGISPVPGTEASDQASPLTRTPARAHL